MTAISNTDFRFPGQTGFYRGKVRDIYFFNKKLAMVATDRISAFDVILPRAIPWKGQVLNQLAAKSLEATSDIVANWVESIPDPVVSAGLVCDPFQVEMVIRGYLAGHAWREYRDGKRSICGVSVPDGLKENDQLPEPIITPTTKAHEGHDEDISKDQILAQGLVSSDHYEALEQYTRALFQRGTELAERRGLILVDTKYEFGLFENKIFLIDEVHTPDSSRYFYQEDYSERQAQKKPQRQLSKEFVRQWLISEGFQGLENQEMPEMPDKVVSSISDRYLELYESFSGEELKMENSVNLMSRIEDNILTWLKKS